MIQVKVKPSSRTSQIVETADGMWSAQLRASPVDGKANQELIALLAEHFDCAKSCITIKSGKTAKMKLIQIDG